MDYPSNCRPVRTLRQGDRKTVRTANLRGRSKTLPLPCVFAACVSETLPFLADFQAAACDLSCLESCLKSSRKAVEVACLRRGAGKPFVMKGAGAHMPVKPLPYHCLPLPFHRPSTAFP